MNKSFTDKSNIKYKYYLSICKTQWQVSLLVLEHLYLCGPTRELQPKVNEVKALRRRKIWDMEKDDWKAVFDKLHTCLQEFMAKVNQM